MAIFWFVNRLPRLRWFILALGAASVTLCLSLDLLKLSFFSNAPEIEPAARIGDRGPAAASGMRAMTRLRRKLCGLRSIASL
jgi:hypothetical protein